MRNRPFTLPAAKSGELSETSDWGNLKNRFSGRILFDYNLFQLESGNLAVLDKINNNWFLDEFFVYSQKFNDPNLIPALKKVAANSDYTESIRQRASEIAETIEEQFVRGGQKITGSRSESEKSESARRMLAGVRYPQTTDILRLLREKSVELKRLALFLIGKFNMTDMIQEVCECLNHPGIEKDAFSTLVSFGNAAGSELNRFYLMSSGNISISRSIVRICAKSCPVESISFLTERLWSNPRQIKEMALKALLKCGYKPLNGDRGKMDRLIFETLSLLTRIASGKLCLASENNDFLYGVLDKEYDRWKDFLLNLLILTYGNEIPALTGSDKPGKEGNGTRHLPEIARIIYSDSGKKGLKNKPDFAAERKRFRRIKRFFDCEIPAHSYLMEYIINCDYNVLGIWTKACALRSIPKIEYKDLGESVVALLFSPEELLRQEAARLIARSGRELYRTTSERIPEPVRKKLDDIISGETDENQLLFEKTGFLASKFQDILEDELLFLAERMHYIGRNTPRVEQGLKGGLLWTFPGAGSEPVISLIHDDEDIAGTVRDLMAVSSFFYLLPFNVIEDFTFQFPAGSYRILKYIDEKEE